MDWVTYNPLALWLAVGGLLLAAEVATGSGWLLWPAGAAVVTALIAVALPLSLPVLAGIFAALTIITTLAGRRFFPHAVTGGDINDTLARLTGSEGVVTQPFHNGSGRVLVDGKEWAAKLDEGVSLPRGSKIIVTGVGGAQLQVRAS